MLLNKGLKTYFAKYAFQNTELLDFINELQKASDDSQKDTDVIAWADSWIKTSGFNIINPILELSEDGNTVKSLKLIQTLAEHGENVLREQKIKIALFNSNFEVEDIIDIKIQATEITEIRQIEGQSAPHAFLLNYEDWGYGRFLIDDRSLKAFQEGLSKIEGSLSRKLIHNTLFTMTRDGQLSANDFGNIIKKQMMQEVNQDIVLEQLRYNMRVIFKNYIPDEYELQESQEMFNFLLTEFLPTASNDQMQQIIVEASISVARSEEHFKLVRIYFIIYSLNPGLKLEKSV